MTIQEALFAMGVREDTLTQDEKAKLDREGFLHLPEILTPLEVEALRARQADLLNLEGDLAGTEVHQEAGTDRLSDLMNKGTIFHIIFKKPRVLAAIAHVLQNDLKLSSLNSRNALPGKGLQGLHADWGRLETPGDYQVCNSLWLLDDFTLENGATRLVPGTHKNTDTPVEAMGNPTLDHPDQIVLIAKAGDVVVVNSHTWHGGTTNRTEGSRRALHAYFARRHQTQQLDQQKFLRPETWNQMSVAERALLGVVEPAQI